MSGVLRGGGAEGGWRFWFAWVGGVGAGGGWGGWAEGEDWCGGRGGGVRGWEIGLEGGAGGCVLGGGVGGGWGVGGFEGGGRGVGLGVSGVGGVGGVDDHVTPSKRRGRRRAHGPARDAERVRSGHLPSDELNLQSRPIIDDGSTGCRVNFESPYCVEQGAVVVELRSSAGPKRLFAQNDDRLRARHRVASRSVIVEPAPPSETWCGIAPAAGAIGARTRKRILGAAKAGPEARPTLE